MRSALRLLVLLVVLVPLAFAACATPPGRPPRPGPSAPASAPPPGAPSPWAAPATGTPNDDAAKKHLESGLRLYDEQAYPEALAAFNEAYRLGSSPTALRYVALVHRQLRRPGAAYDAFEQLLAKHDAQLTPDERREAQKALDELGAVTATLLVVVNEPDAEIEIDGRPAGRSPMAKPRRFRANDRHAVRVAKPGFSIFEQQNIEVAAREAKKIEVKLEPEKGGAAAGLPPAGMNEAERKATARAAFAEGVALQDKGDCAAALPRFETAQRLHDAPTQLLHIAQCQAALGKLVEAQESYETLAHKPLDKNAPDAFQKAQDQGKQELPGVKARVPTLKVQTTPPATSLTNLVVQVNGARMANDLVGLARPVNPGGYKITALASGYKQTVVEVVLVEKEQRTVELRLR